MKCFSTDISVKVVMFQTKAVSLNDVETASNILMAGDSETKTMV